MRIADLEAPVTAAKSDWLPGTTWLGFTPRGEDLTSRNQCQSTVQRQFGRGYVLEYVTVSMERPNPEFVKTERYEADRARHEQLAGKLIAVHRLQTTSRPLIEIVGPDEFNLLQDMWAQPGTRRRWSVAFPIVESYEVVGHPYAREVLGSERYLAVFTQQSAVLRPLSDEDRRLLADVEILRVPARNEKFLFDAELEKAALSEVDPNLLKHIERDLPDWAFEGEVVERFVKVRKRCAQVASKFIRMRRGRNQLVCDDCGFDPSTRLPAGVDPRKLLEVHHKYPMEAGFRRTTVEDFALFCPTCHTVAHVMLQQIAKGRTAIRGTS